MYEYLIYDTYTNKESSIYGYSLADALRRVGINNMGNRYICRYAIYCD